MEISMRARLLWSVAAISLGAGLLAVTFIGWHYESRIKTLKQAHAAQMSSMERRHRKEVRDTATVRDSVQELEKKIEILIATKGKQ